jgi:antitoxin (DNA-binding transcriptional repressor) of toxin-antitoxin stability system
LSRLLVHVGNGEEVIIARAGRPVARLVPTKAKPGHREPGSAAGKVIIMPDFDAPLPEDVVRAFEG